MGAEDFAAILIKHAQQIDMNNMDRYRDFFGLDTEDIIYIDNDVFKLIEVIKTKRFQEIFGYEN